MLQDLVLAIAAEVHQKAVPLALNLAVALVLLVQYLAVHHLIVLVQVVELIAEEVPDLERDPDQTLNLLKKRMSKIKLKKKNEIKTKIRKIKTRMLIVKVDLQLKMIEINRKHEANLVHVPALIAVKEDVVPPLLVQRKFILAV